MRSFHCRFALVGLLMLAALTGCFREMHVTTTLKPDGSVRADYDVVMGRDDLVQMLEARRQMEAQIGLGDDDEPAADAAAADKKPAGDGDADKQLEAELRQMLSDRSGMSMMGMEYVVDKIEVKPETVRIMVHVDFEDLESWVSKSGRNSGIGDRLVVDKTDEGKLRVAMPGRSDLPPQAMQMMKAELQKTELKMSWKLRMPGKVISATGAQAKDDEASVSFDLTENKDEAIAAMIDLQTKGITVVSEPGQLSLEGLPLDSAKLAPPMVMPGAVGADVPVTEAQQQYVVEPMVVTTTSVRWYPEGRKLLGADDEDSYSYEYSQTSACEVRARLHAPQGTSILAIANPTITSAVDDKGRPIPALHEQGQNISFGVSDEENDHGDFDLDLKLPPADAQAIERLEGTVIVTSCTGWKELAVTHEASDGKKEVDLSPLIEGAKMVIGKSKHSIKRQQRATQAEGGFEVVITGAGAAQGLDFDVRIDGIERVNAYDSSTSRSGGTIKRQIRYNAFHHSENDGQVIGKPTLVVRMPQNLKRENVKFTLEAMDLF